MNVETESIHNNNKINLQPMRISSQLVEKEAVKLSLVNRKIRRLNQRVAEKLELYGLIEGYNWSTKDPDRRVVCRCFNRKCLTGIINKINSEDLLTGLAIKRKRLNHKLSLQLVYTHMERYNRVGCSQEVMERLNYSLQRNEKISIIYSRLNWLLMKKRTFGFLNQSEKFLVSEYSNILRSIVL